MPKQPIWKKIRLILLTCIMLGLIIVSFGPILMSPMMFDAPESTESVMLWIIFTLIWLFPLVALGGIIYGWIHYRKNKNIRSASRWMCLGLGHIIILISIVAIYTLFFEPT